MSKKGMIRLLVKNCEYDMDKDQTKRDYSWYLDVLLLIVIIGGLFFIQLGSRPLFVPDEGRYAEIAREMLQSGNYITPTLNHIKYFEKPVLFYWLGAAVIKIGGLNLWSLRSINGLLGLLGCLCTYAFTRRLYNRLTGLLAALILATSMLYFVMVHMISLDLPVSVFLAITFYAFLLATKIPQGPSRRALMATSAIAAALAVLTKGLIGVVFPLLVIGSWIILLGEWKWLKKLYLPSSLLLFFIIAAPWHLLAGYYNPEFFYFYFVEQHFLRYTSMDIGHYQPAWFFIPILIAGFFPWIVFLPQAFATHCKLAWHRSSTELFFILWIMLVFVFFSFSHSKLIPYILPIFPPLSIITAHYLTEAIAKKQLKGIKISYLCMLMMTLLVGYIAWRLINDTALPNIYIAALYLYTGTVVLVLGVLISLVLMHKYICKALVVTILFSGIFLLCLFAAFPAMDARSIYPFALMLKPMLKPQDEVVAYDQYYQDLPFYLERRISIVNWHNELEFGMRHQDTREWMINEQIFWQRWQSKKQLFVVMDLATFKQFQQQHPDARFYLMGITINNVLITNKPNVSMLLNRKNN